MISDSAPTPAGRALIGVSQALLRSLDEARAAAASKRPILLTAETGCGKTLFAREIHDRSERSGRPFVVWSAPEGSDSLGLRELFGHVRGAYTGADQGAPGIIDSAQSGTLVVDDVDKLSQRLQASLLRFLDHGTFRRLGDIKEYFANVRLIFTLNRPLTEVVEEKLFLPDLAWRLRFLNIRIPALRERPEDVPHLVEHYAHAFALEYGKPVPEVTKQAFALLMQAPWPGNVRQLAGLVENLVFRAADGKGIGPAEVRRELENDQPIGSDSAPSNGSLSPTREDIVRALEAAKWNCVIAAERFDTSLSTFRRWMKRHALEGRNRRSAKPVSAGPGGGL
jgi:DNA-binding NtrC family response regulator